MTPKDNIHIGKNIKHLRKLRGLTQQDLADILAIRRSNIGAYEEGRATPRYETLQSMAKHFEISVDRLLSEDLTKLSEKEIRESNQKPGDKNGTTARIIAITVDKQGKDNVTLVPVKASAGYLNGYADPEYFDSLPTLSLPMLGPGSFRGFEIKGDSMNPLPEGSIVVGELVESLDQIKDG
ncbi:MAG: XRE family transcriptional regulator, partial [Bacteroidetes bacterium]